MSNNSGPVIIGDYPQEIIYDYIEDVLDGLMAYEFEEQYENGELHDLVNLIINDYSSLIPEMKTYSQKKKEQLKQFAWRCIEKRAEMEGVDIRMDFPEHLRHFGYRKIQARKTTAPRRRTTRKSNGISALKNAYRKML